MNNFEKKLDPWEKPEAKDKPNHARDTKKWAAARAAATKKYGKKNSYVKNQYAARIYGEKGGHWNAKKKNAKKKSFADNIDWYIQGRSYDFEQ